MFRLLLILALLFLIVGTAWPQANDRYQKDSAKIWESPTYIIEPDDVQVKDKQEVLPALPFASIIIKDVRFDTSYIGVINSKKFLTAKGFHKIKFNDGIENVLARILNDTTRFVFTPGPYHLLCFLKQLRVTQEDSIPVEGKAKKLYTTANIAIDAFLAFNGNCYPVLRLDTVASSFDIEEKDFTVLGNVLTAFVKKIGQTDTAKILMKKFYSLNEVKDTYAKRFNKPIIKDPVLNKGVFKTYEEFINNNPSVREYEFKKGGILYTKVENNNWVPTREAFGFCDGNRIWLNVNKSFYPLIRVGDTFEFLTDVRLANESTARSKKRKIYLYTSPGMSVAEYSAMAATAGALILLLSHYSNSPKFVYQLNLETGEVY